MTTTEKHGRTSGRAIFLILALLGAASGCGSNGVAGGKGGGNGNGGGGNGGSAGKGGAAGSDAAGGNSPDAAADSGGQPGDLVSCAQVVANADRVPVDLLFVLDYSASMATPLDRTMPSGEGPQNTLLGALQDTVTSFIKDPKSAGLGVGLEIFPSTTEFPSCNTDADCAGATCDARLFCKGSPTAYLCDPKDPAGSCPGGTCLPLGVCMGGTADPAASAQTPAPGIPVPGPLYCGIGAGVGCTAAQTCAPVPKACSDGTCNLLLYKNPTVPIGVLPGAAATLTAGLVGGPRGETPTVSALQGGYAYLTRHLAEQPGRRGVLVLITDGRPSDCGLTADLAIKAVTDRIAAAAQASPSVTTFVIGIFSSSDPGSSPLLNSWASAGQTSGAFMVGPDKTLGTTLNAALDTIRGQQLPCDFVIPQDKAGSIDFGEVNLTLKAPSGEQALGYVGKADNCAARNDGWYYDVDPAGAARPQRISVCPRTCQRFQSGGGLQATVTFGCKTLVIP